MNETGVCRFCVNGDDYGSETWESNEYCPYKQNFGTCWHPNDSLAEDEDDRYDEEQYVMAFGERGDIG